MGIVAVSEDATIPLTEQMPRISEAPTKKPKLFKDFYVQNLIMQTFMNVIKMKLIRLNEKAKEEDIATVQQEFETQIARCIRFFETGKLDEEPLKGGESAE